LNGGLMVMTLLLGGALRRWRVRAPVGGCVGGLNQYLRTLSVSLDEAADLTALAFDRGRARSRATERSVAALRAEEFQRLLAELPSADACQGCRRRTLRSRLRAR